MEYITTPTVSEILREEFMEPLGISAYRLAQAINVPASRVQISCMIEGKLRQILRFDWQIFGVSDRYFLDLQMILIYENLKIQLANEFPNSGLSGWMTAGDSW